MSDAAVKRPPILTGACLYLGLLSAVMSIRAITVVSSWNAEDRASEVGTSLGLLRDAGMGADAAESVYKAFLTVLAVLGAAGVVFAVYTARGDRVSRIGMTVTIGIAGIATFLGALGTSFFLVMLGALAVVFGIRLWTGEIRTYFRTLAGHPPVLKAPAPAPAAATQVQGREVLPRSVAIAVWTTLIGSVVAVTLSALALLMIGVSGLDYDAVIEQGGPGADMVRGSEGDFDTALRLLVTLCSIAVVLGVGGLVASIRVLRSRRSGDVLLFVMAVVTLIFSVVGFPLGLPWTAAAIVAIVQLRRADSRAWFAKT